MTNLKRQFARFSEEYFQVTGTRPKGFICPITLKDVPEEDLCGGHILNAALGAASFEKILQYADVDHYYGGTNEPELIDFLNFPVMSAADRLKKFKSFYIKLNGEVYEVFAGGREASKRFPRIEILNSEGKVIGERYLKSAKIAPGHYSDVEAEFFLTVHDFALIGALLKSAYLAIFRMVRYRYGLDALGSLVRRALAEFYLGRAGRTNAKHYFGDFRGAVIVSLGGPLDDLADTLEAGWMLTHYAGGSAETGLLFASSILFRVNSVTLVVTVPAYSRYGYSLDALSYYRRLLADRSLKHSIHLTQFRGDLFEVSKQPLETHHVTANNAMPLESLPP